MSFSIQKNGYNTAEVDSFIATKEKEHKKVLAEKNAEINELKVEVAKIQGKSNSIALALTAAVDKAKEIEESSKNIYKLKIEQMNILYTKWDMLLNEMLRKYPAINSISNVREDMENLKSSIKNALKDDFNVEILQSNVATDPIRALLNKLTGSKAKDNDKFILETKQKIKLERKTKVSLSDKTELTKLEEKAPYIKPIADVKLEKDEKYENLVDKFLNSDEENNSAYAKSLTVSKPTKSAYEPNETGFDLNECINPTDDLTEIMKSFDFFNSK